jgi:transcriptional regulator with XRE-family HTH domain
MLTIVISSNMRELRVLREIKKLSQRELGELTGIPVQRISKIERGLIAPTTSEKVRLENSLKGNSAKRLLKFRRHRRRIANIMGANQVKIVVIIFTVLYWLLATASIRGPRSDDQYFMWAFCYGMVLAAMTAAYWTTAHDQYARDIERIDHYDSWGNHLGFSDKDTGRESLIGLANIKLARRLVIGIAVVALFTAMSIAGK